MLLECGWVPLFCGPPSTICSMHASIRAHACTHARTRTLTHASFLIHSVPSLFIQFHSAYSFSSTVLSHSVPQCLVIQFHSPKQKGAAAQRRHCADAGEVCEASVVRTAWALVQLASHGAAPDVWHRGTHAWRKEIDAICPWVSCSLFGLSSVSGSLSFCL